MKRKALSIALLTLSLSLIGGSLALAGGAHGPLGLFALGEHAHQAIGALIQRLDLNDDQEKHIEAIHHIMAERLHAAPEAHRSHVKIFLGRVESGYIDPMEARQTVDAHINQMRHNAYRVTDEMVALINSLDSTQREILVEHLQEALHAAEEHAQKTDADSSQGHGGH